MNILKKEYKQCVCCMEWHEVALVTYGSTAKYKDEVISYEEMAEYCEVADECFVSEEMWNKNDIAVKDAYRKMKNLSTSEDIRAIRERYSMSQKDMAILLDWGEKTITRYEGHQVQDAAHDAILRKIEDDPYWVFLLLEKQREEFPEKTFLKYHNRVIELLSQSQDAYLRKSIIATYSKYTDKDIYTGGCEICFDKIVDVVRYFSNADTMEHLYKVKMMKLLWYADALSYQRRGKSMLGLVYQAQPMGALPIAHKLLMALDGIEYEEIEFGDSTGYRFVKSSNTEYTFLSDDDMDILEQVIAEFATSTREEIVARMHSEKAYLQTRQGDIISYEWAKEISL